MLVISVEKKVASIISRPKGHMYIPGQIFARFDISDLAEHPGIRGVAVSRMVFDKITWHVECLHVAWKPRITASGITRIELDGVPSGVFSIPLWHWANAGLLLLGKSKYECIEIVIHRSPRLVSNGHPRLMLSGSPRLVLHGYPGVVLPVIPERGTNIGPVLPMICRLGFIENLLH